MSKSKESRFEKFLSAISTLGFIGIILFFIELIFPGKVTGTFDSLGESFVNFIDNVLVALLWSGIAAIAILVVYKVIFRK